jgi:hypothetical protein
MITRLEPALRALAAIFLIIAIAGLFWPSGPSRAVIAPELQSAPTKQTIAAQPAVADAIIASNIFSSSRKPPRSRYNPFEPEPTPVETIPDVGAAEPVPDEDAVPRLFGIVIGPRGAEALLRLDRTIPDAQLYKEGDRAGVYRVVKVEAQSVTLTGPRGRVVLQLKRPENP